MVRFFTLALAAIAVVSMAGLGFAAGVDVGEKAPDFKELPTADGKKISLSDSADSKATVVCFTCNNCLVAVAYQDDFVNFTKEYKDNSSIASFDKEAAKKQLDELGWKLEGETRKKDGKELVVRYVIPTPNVVADQIAKLVQSQLKEVGAKVDIQAVPSADFFKQFVNVGNFDMTGFRWLASATPISDGKGIYYLDPASTNQNYGRIGSEEVNKLLDQANGELDDTKRAELANEADKKIWELGHQLPLYQLPGAVAVKSNVANFGAVAYANRPYDYINMGFTE